MSELDSVLAAKKKLKLKPVATAFSWEDERFGGSGEARGAGFQAVAGRGLL